MKLKLIAFCACVLAIAAFRSARAQPFSSSLYPGLSCNNNLFCRGDVDQGIAASCLTPSQLCDGTIDCLPDGTDEGLSSLDNNVECNLNSALQPMYRCSANMRVPITDLCDGTADCSGGEDETRAVLCLDKCRPTYSGGCSEENPQFVCVPRQDTANCDCNDTTTFVRIGSFCIVRPITIGWNAPEVTVIEGTDPFATVCATVIAGDITLRTFTLNVATAVGTATAADFTPLPPSTEIVISETNPTVCVNINITNDAFVEPDQSFTVELTDPNNNADLTVSPAVITVVITDDDVASFRFDPVTYSIQEGAMPSVTLTVVMDSPAMIEKSITLIAQSVDGTATAVAPIDFAAVNSRDLPFAAGSVGGVTSVTIVIEILNDDIVEADEMFTVTISTSDQDATITADTAVVTITEDPADSASFSFDPSAYTAQESSGAVTINVVMVAGTLERSISLLAVHTDGSATAGNDFQAVSETVVFPAGSVVNSNEDFSVTIIDDSIFEGDEMFSLSLSSSDSAATVVQDTATVTINETDFVEVAFAAPSYSFDEGEANPQVCVEITSGTAAQPFTITFSNTSGTAISPADYSLPNNSQVTFPGGSTQGGAARCITLIINNENIVEVDEELTISIAAASNAVVINIPTITVTIENNDDATFGFNPVAYTVTEGTDTVAIISIELSQGSLGRSILLSVQSNDVTANAGSDYDAVDSQAVEFLSGDAASFIRQISVTITNDNAVEGTESFSLTLSSGDPNAVLVDTTATVTILDDATDSATFGFNPFTYSDNEAVGTITVTAVLLSGILERDVEVIINSNDGSALAGSDYSQISDQQLVFSSGVSMHQIIVTIVNDDILESAESFTLVMTSTDSSAVIDSTSGVATCTITDDDDVVIRFSDQSGGALDAVQVNEGQGYVEKCVSVLNGTLERAVDFSVSLSNGSAQEGSDYSGTSFPMSLSFDASNAGMVMCFNISIVDDAVAESTETFTVSLNSADSDITFDPATCTVTVLDDDGITIGFSDRGGSAIDSIDVVEGQGYVEKCVSVLSGSLAREFEFMISLTSSGSAVEGSDYSGTNFPLTLSFDAASAGMVMCFNITIVDDFNVENDESFTVELSSSDSAITFDPDECTVNIIDDDGITIGFTDRSGNSISGVQVNESQGYVEKCVSVLDGQVVRDFQFVVSLSDGSAIDGDDYSGSNFPLTLTYNTTNGGMTLCFRITIVNDNCVEMTESFNVTLSSTDPAITFNPATCTVTIYDDDMAIGDDPHFSIVLPSGKLLCYTVQGEHNSIFNLISNNKVYMNAKFVPDARREEVTWIGSMGIVVRNSAYKDSNATKLRFEVEGKRIFVGDKVVLKAKNVEKLVFSNGKLTISETEGNSQVFKYPAVSIDLQDVGLTLTIKFTNQHLDLFWSNVGVQNVNSHGLIGQFFRKGVEIDQVRKLLIMPNKEPVPVMRRPVWSFMERDVPDEQLCWTAMNAGYQGKGLIDGTYKDYILQDILSEDFKIPKQ